MKDGKNKGAAVLDEVGGVMRSMYIKMVPSYGNNFFFTIGIYLLELFVILAVTGIIMLIFGPYWWDLTPLGTFFRSVHLWAAEAFVTLMFVHLFVNFSTSAFKKKKLVWVIGSAMLFLVLLQFAFGIGIEGGLLSQWNLKAGADLWNGMGLGYWINPMNVGAVVGWHIAILPILLMGLMFMHYSLVKKKGLSKPYRNDIPYKMAYADHRQLYKRMVYVAVIVLMFAVIFSSPYIPPLTISKAASSNPQMTAIAFLNEFNYSSATAQYTDTIDPYTFSTRTAYVTTPYDAYLNLTGSKNYEAELAASPNESAYLSSAFTYFSGNGSISMGLNSTNPAVAMASELTVMAEHGTYEDVLQGEVASGLNETYVIRFLADSHALGSEARAYYLRSSQFGMLMVGGPPWSIQYWLLPYNILEIKTSSIPWWGDLENGTVALLAFLVLMLFPFIPYLNEIPDKLKMYKLFWNRFTVPEMRSKRTVKRTGRK